MQRFILTILLLPCGLAGCSCKTNEGTNTQKSDPQSEQSSSTPTDARQNSGVEPNGIDVDSEVPVGAPASRSVEARSSFQESFAKHARAESLAKKGQYGKAYSLTLEAWLLVKDESDEDCKKLSGELMKALEEFGENANAAAQQNNDLTKPIRVQ